MLHRFFSVVALFLFLLGQVSADCSGLTGTFKNEKGDFSLSWCVPSGSDEMTLTFSLAGTSFIALGFGGSMYEADMIAGWVTSTGEVVADDYFSSEEAKPQTDVSLGGRNDVQVVAGSRTSTSTSLTVKRKIITGDKYDKDISLTSANDMIYAWDTADNTGIGYHGDNHNHVFIDFSRPDGIPLNTFGEEESGVLSRRLVRDMYFGTLSTFQTEKAGAVSNFPFGTVSDFADDGTGRPIILLSNLERSVINMQTSPSCSLSIQQAPNTTLEFTHPEVYDVMTKPRTTLMGKLTPVPKEELDQAKAIYLSKHPKSKAWINFSDFTMYYMAVEDIYVIAGFGNDHYIGWISPAQYYSVTI